MGRLPAADQVFYGRPTWDDVVNEEIRRQEFNEQNIRKLPEPQRTIEMEAEKQRQFQWAQENTPPDPLPVATPIPGALAHALRP